MTHSARAQRTLCEQVVIAHHDTDQRTSCLRKAAQQSEVPSDTAWVRNVGPYPRFVDTVVDYAAAGRIAADVVS